MATEGKSKLLFWAAAAVVLVLLLKYWKRFRASNGANLGPTATFDPDRYAPETIDYLNTLKYCSPFNGPTDMPLYYQYLLIRDITPVSERASNPAFADVIAQMNDAIKAHFPAAQL